MAKNQTILSSTNYPRQLFGMDLKKAVESKIEKCHQIILMGDFNSEYEDLITYILDLGLQDLIRQKHGKGPKIHDHSKDSPIYCIFGSASLKISKGGFLSFGRLLSDHIGVWIDILKLLLYGYNPTQSAFHGAIKSKLTDPRLVEKYLAYLHCAIIDNDLFRRIDEIHRDEIFMEEKSNLSNSIVDRYEEIDIFFGKLMYEVEDQCCTLHTWTIQFPLTYKYSLLGIILLVKKACILQKRTPQC